MFPVRSCEKCFTKGIKDIHWIYHVIQTFVIRHVILWEGEIFPHFS